MTAGNSPTSSPEQRNRRRQHYIKPPFQLRFILQFTSLLIVGCLSFGFSVYLYSKPTFTTAFIQSKLRVMNTSDFLLPALILATLGVTAIVSFAAVLRLLLLSHRIAGPLYRLEKTAQAIGSGNLNQSVRLRANDQLQDFARTMDEMVRDLRLKAQVIKKQNDRLKGIISQADRTPGLSQELLRELKDIQHQLDETVSRFQV